MRRFAIVALAVTLACESGAKQGYPIPGDREPALTVEVLNANGRAGDARVGTRLLRRAGIDVVYFGNAPQPDAALDSTRIIVRRGGPDVGERVRSALGSGRVQVEHDSSRLLDVSVLLGADFAPARSADFHP